MYTLSKSILAAVVATVAFTACSSAHDETGAATTPSPSAGTPAPNPAMTDTGATSSTTTSMLISTTQLDSQVSDGQLTTFRGRLAGAPALEDLDVSTPTLDMIRATSGTRVQATLESAEVHDTKLTDTATCDASEGKPNGAYCEVSNRVRSARFVFIITDSAPFGGGVPAAEATVGTSVEVDVLGGLLDTGSAERDIATESAIDKVVASAPIGAPFVMFLTGIGGRPRLSMFGAWAAVDDSGKLVSMAVGPDIDDKTVWTAAVRSLDDFVALANR